MGDSRPTSGVPPASVAHPAASVVIVRPGPRGSEILLTQRPPTMVFGPDMHVFPGGRVDAADRDAADAEATDVPAVTAPDLRAHVRAAVREVEEEVGIRLAPAGLIPLNRWVTPRSWPRRFDARSFAAFVAPETAAVPAPGEVVAAAWWTPTAALAAWRAGALQLWPPTIVTLRQLDAIASDLTPAAVAGAFATEESSSLAPGVALSVPRLEPVSRGVRRLVQGWAGGIAGRIGTGWLVGEREVVVVDPVDPTGEATELVEATVDREGGRLVGVVLSDISPVRMAGVEMYATGLGLPIVGGPGSSAWGLATHDGSIIEVAIGGRAPFGDVGLRLEMRGGIETWRTDEGAPIGPRY